MTRMTVAPPRTMSPPAKMVGMDDCMFSLTAIVPFRHFRPKAWAVAI